MTVMLLQRFSAPQSNLTKKKFYHSCDNDIGNNSGQQTVKIKTKNNKKQLKDKKDSLETSTSYYSNNILSNTITTTINNNNNNNTNNNNNNNSENIENNCEEFCKNEKYHCTGSCLNKKTVTNININNSNNNSNNNNIINNNNNNNNNNININNNNNNNEEEREEDEFLTRDKQNIRQETITSHTTTITGGTTGTIGTSVSQNRYYSQGVAMRYYRLWIYACNIVLLGSALGLALALLRSLVFTRDPRRYLVPGVPRVFDPTALYAYLALATQLGLVQLLGCIAARRLSAKLLNAYWVLLLALLFGDAIIGVAWVFRFEKIRAELRPTLKLKLQLDYGRDQRFSDNWDRLQRDFSCCGVTGPGDYPTRFYPETCCPIDLNKYIQSQSANNNNKNNKNINYNKNNNNINNNYNNNNDTNISSYNNACHQPYSHGCEENLISWMRKTADLLFVIGFCVMAFSKLCFLGILRYEIREMIQKIQLLRDPPPPASATFIQSFCQVPSQVTTIQNNNNATTTTTTTTTTGGITTGTTTISDTSGYCHSNYGGTRRTTLPIVVSSSIVNNNPTGFGNNMPVSYEQDYNGKHPLLFTSNLQQDTGADSDTNSHCALILEESTTTPPCQRNYTTAINSQREKNNGNNNNNNNYEMREFNRRYLMSNGTGSPPSGIKIIPQNRRT